MSTNFMVTIAKSTKCTTLIESGDYISTEWEQHPKKLLFKFLEEYDSHKWIVGFERGKKGYEHIQARFNLSKTKEEGFLLIKEYFPTAHVEECSDVWEYECKEGRYLRSDDTPEIRAVRFGKLNEVQEGIMEALQDQNDRQVDVWYDKEGCHGKSWLTVHLWETRQALVVPRYSCTAEKLSAYICSAYHGEPIVVIDIPRANKPTLALYEAIEEVKDGLVFDPRYHGQCRDIRGAKVVVFTNTWMDQSKLSGDRWRWHYL